MAGHFMTARARSFVKLEFDAFLRHGDLQYARCTKTEALKSHLEGLDVARGRKAIERMLYPLCWRLARPPAVSVPSRYCPSSSSSKR